MKQKALLLLTLLFVSGCTTAYPPTQAVVVQNTRVPLTISPTDTPVPSATIGYEQTALIAQQTADEARRVNAVVTAEFEQRVQDQLVITSQAEQRNFEILSWTVTAAQTSLPMTAAQQSTLNAQVSGQQTLVSSQFTATAHAPTQIVLMANAQNYAVVAKTSKVVDIFVRFCIGIIFLGITFFLVRNPEKPKQNPQKETHTEPAKPLGTIISVSKPETGAIKRFEIPCSPEQLTELAEKITQGERTLAINQWEGKETLFTRAIIIRVRSWIRENEFAIPLEDNQLAPTNDFLALLCGWLDKQSLPVDYYFGGEAVTPA